MSEEHIEIPIEVLQTRPVSNALDAVAERLSEALTLHFYEDAPAAYLRELDDQLRDLIPAMLFRTRLPSMGQLVSEEAAQFLGAA